MLDLLIIFWIQLLGTLSYYHNLHFLVLPVMFLMSFIEMYLFQCVDTSNVLKLLELFSFLFLFLYPPSETHSFFKFWIIIQNIIYFNSPIKYSVVCCRYFKPLTSTSCPPSLYFSSWRQASLAQLVLDGSPLLLSDIGVGLYWHAFQRPSLNKGLFCVAVLFGIPRLFLPPRSDQTRGHRTSRECCRV